MGDSGLVDRGQSDFFLANVSSTSVVSKHLQVEFIVDVVEEEIT